MASPKKDVPQQVQKAVRSFVEASDDPANAVNAIRSFIHDIAPTNQNPVDYVRWVPIDQVQANDYNPNSVASTEMQLLATSIRHDGYTQPVVTIWDEAEQKYIIVDGFHRYFTCKTTKDIYERNNGLLPIVVIQADINHRMASTVRHNRARGKHSIKGMANMVFEMLDNGWADEDICNEMGMQPEELLRLKHITGFSKLFANAEYKKAWETRQQIQFRKQWQDQQQEQKEG